MSSLAHLLNVAAASKAALNLSDIIRPISGQLKTVEDILDGVAKESNGILQESSRYVLSGGGKRLRAALVFFSASIQPGSRAGTNPACQSRAAADVAAAVELIHAATLVHDDIIDRAVLRRLRPTVAVHFGEEVAVLLGDFLYARAFDMIARVGDAEITSSISDTTRKMCEGEIGQLKSRYRADLSMEEYLAFIEQKTALLIAACARAGAKLGGLSAREQDNLASFGRNIGISFQIVDDLLDIIGSEHKVGKTLHTDTGNGKMTLPMILLSGDMDASERKTFQDNFLSQTPDWTQIQALIAKYKIVERTEQAADDYFKSALKSIQDFDPAIRDSLDKLSRFILKRDY